MDFTQMAFLFAAALALTLLVLTFAAYSALLERKVTALMQGRPGPNRTTFPLLQAIPIAGNLLKQLGIVQLPADAAKLLLKEDRTPGHVQKFWYCLAPCLALALPIAALVVFPFGQYSDAATGTPRPLALCNVDSGFLFAATSLGAYVPLLAAWASNSKYPFLGAIRSTAQSLPYGLALLLVAAPVILATARPGVESPLNLFTIVNEQGGFWNLFTQPLGAGLFLVVLFFESNRQPFDMPESGTDLVGGSRTEYGSLKLGLFFLGESTHALLGGAFFVLLFLGGWHLPVLPSWLLEGGWVGTALGVAIFLSKLFLIAFLFIWVRGTLPRFRYDQVMHLGWTTLLPLAFANLFIYLLFYALWP